MSIDTINYLLSKYYEGLTEREYLYRQELENPSCYTDIEPKVKYKVEINLLKKLIEDLEELRDSLQKFEV